MKQLESATTFIVVILVSMIVIQGLMTFEAGATAPDGPHLANAMWIEPSVVSLSTEIQEIGYRFNVTVWTNVTSVQSPIQALTAWQFVVAYDRSMLNTTRCRYTQGSKSQFFSNISTVSVGPESGALNATHDFVMQGESWVTGAKRGVPGYGSLSWIEFEVTSKPAQGQAFTCMISLQTTGVRICKILDDELNKVTFMPYHTFYRYGIYDAAVINLTPYKNVTCLGYCMTLSVTITNQGSFSELFNITVYANATAIEPREVTLTSGTSTTVNFTWNTTGFAKGNYTVWAYAEPVQGETHTADNTYADGWIIVAIVGDITGPDGWPDGKCDMRDIGLVAKDFGMTVPPANPNCDLTGPTAGVPDGVINMRDIGLVAKHFGDH